MEVNQRTRLKRALRVRQRIRGTRERPRLSVFKSNRHLSAQVIDDERGRTLVGLATYSKEFRNSQWNRINREAAAQLGRRIAELAREQGIEWVVFDRGPFKYHGVLAALADAAREGGLQF
jgi:large subunit ribosomal protein L18